MLITFKRKMSFTHPRNYSLLLAFVWTFVIAVSLVASITAHRQEIVTIARNIARAYIDKDILYRSWNAMHGGVYVVVGKGTLPNQYFPPSIDERDVITPSGRHLTLVNPAYMTRQIYELAQKEHKISGRITSLKPLRPENRANEWETAALLKFERGEQEVSSEVTEENTKYLQLMRPLVTEESCLPCHLHQGYKKGDIRGGISVKLPMMLFEPASRKGIGLLWAGHGVMWMLGLAGLYIGYTGMRQRTEERDLATGELQRLNVVLENQAMTDALTGIFNRRKFLESLQVKIQEAKRYNRSLPLIFFDIDHFKSVNDTYGHEVGDSVLVELSRLVSGMIRQTDLFARFGGEEFILLVQNSDVRTGGELAEKIREGVESHSFPMIGVVTCSFGVAHFLPDDTAETFIKRADDAMYTAKQAGRNRVET